MKIIDAHIHLFKKPYSDLFDNSHIKAGKDGELHLYREYREKYDIEAAFVICYDEGHCPGNTVYVKSLARDEKWIYSFGYVKPGINFATAAHKLISDGYFGISCYLKPDDSGAWLGDSELEFLRDKNIPLSLSIRPHQCRELIKTFKNFPRVTILINHLGRPELTEKGLDFEKYKNVLALAKFENVYIKLSGFYAFSHCGWRCPQSDLFEVIDLLKQNFGAERLLFASDFSPVLEFNTYKQTLELLHSDYNGFSETELEKIYYSNAKKIISERG
ncbi:MAG: amidohydrolase family protein [Victivallales bacterium]|nr:amidohydrolase family protein [Victivallales bacterium]